MDNQPVVKPVMPGGSSAPLYRSSHRSIWVWLIILVIVVSLLVVAWQKGIFNSSRTKELSPEEMEKINAFLSSESVVPPTPEEVEGIKSYLNQSVSTTTDQEEAKILEYLNQ